eukprot:3627393-Rhodomonas_salina.1
MTDGRTEQARYPVPGYPGYLYRVCIPEAVEDCVLCSRSQHRSTQGIFSSSGLQPCLLKRTRSGHPPSQKMAQSAETQPVGLEGDFVFRVEEADDGADDH